MRRRDVLMGFAVGAAAQRPVPTFLAGFEEAYRQNPRSAALDWFRTARFGLFMHFGLYSLLGRGEWVMHREKIPVAEYSRLKGRFTAAKFDADRVVNLALEAGMKYVNLTVKHHDGFCLFRTGQTDFNSMESPARRDLVAELAAACRKSGLGLCLYYSYAADWRHPYFPAREAGWTGYRPPYEKPDPAYFWRKDRDAARYIEFAHRQLRELLTQYGPLAAIWLDPLLGYYMRPDLFPVHEAYTLIRSLQPQCLICFKQGANGEEDFAAPERRKGIHPAHHVRSELAERVWRLNKNKPAEVCDTLQNRWWGYNRDEDGKHKNADDVMRALESARAQHANLLLNTGPLPDGSIAAEDEATLREAGRRLRLKPLD